MAKTLLQLLNDVGKNLRRSTGSTYTSITQNADAVFIVQAINEAKRRVEGAWKWDVLRTTITFDSVADTATYDTSDLAVVTSDPTVTREEAYILHDAAGRLQFWDVSSAEETRLFETTRDRARHLNIINTISVERPHLVTVYPNGSGLTAHFAYAPTGVRSYSFDCVNPQAELTDAADVLLVPWRLVVLAATALAFDERGEELGGASDRWWDNYENALGVEIGRDAQAADFTLVSDSRADAPNYWNA